MTGMAVLDFVYAVVLIGGGLAGYARAKSSASLLSGGLFGVLAAVAGVLLLAKHPRSGLGLSAVVALIVEAVFALRLRKTRQPMPAVPIIAISALVLAASLVEFALRSR